MPLIVPGELIPVLEAIERTAASIDEHALITQLLTALDKDRELMEDEHKGAFAEIEAWRFQRTQLERRDRNAQMSRRIFISHALTDKQLADAFVDLLQIAAGVPTEDIFCSSLEGMGIPARADFIRYIKDEIQKPELVVAPVPLTSVCRELTCNSECRARHQHPRHSHFEPQHRDHRTCGRNQRVRFKRRKLESSAVARTHVNISHQGSGDGARA